MKYSILALIAPLLFLPSCSSNEEFEDKMNARNEAYYSWDERRAIRLNARQDRTDAWFSRHMNSLD